MENQKNPQETPSRGWRLISLNVILGRKFVLGLSICFILLLSGCIASTDQKTSTKRVSHLIVGRCTRNRESINSTINNLTLAHIKGLSVLELAVNAVLSGVDDYIDEIIDQEEWDKIFSRFKSLGLRPSNKSPSSYFVDIQNILLWIELFYILESGQEIQP